jgi:hypothetical protein
LTSRPDVSVIITSPKQTSLRCLLLPRISQKSAYADWPVHYPGCGGHVHRSMNECDGVLSLTNSAVSSSGSLHD